MKYLQFTAVRFPLVTPFNALSAPITFHNIPRRHYLFQASVKRRVKPRKHNSQRDPKDVYFKEFSSKEIKLSNNSKSESPSVNNVLNANKKNEIAKYGFLKGRQIRYTMLLFAGISLGIGVMLPEYMRAPTTASVLNETSFTPFRILKREQISSTAFILTLGPIQTRAHETESDPYRWCWEQGIWSVEVRQPELQIARSYTPLPPLPGQTVGHLRFLIRKEPGGELSGYLHRLPVGAMIDLRGPHQEVPIHNSVNEVLFLAGGTGIAPALQVAHTLLETRLMQETHPRMHIIWANRRREDCHNGTLARNGLGRESSGNTHPIVNELERLQKSFPRCVSVEYLVDEEGTFLTPNKILEAVRKVTGPTGTLPSQRVLFVSGPEGFINATAGPKGWEDGIQVQGDVGGFLQKFKLDSWEVRKL
ncbi:hypothetical protein K3495_g194 [Podosphaera aphanis]|nr:hypothetical protein K3495_g194 [Podosphaera aphanis]